MLDVVGFGVFVYPLDVCHPCSVLDIFSKLYEFFWVLFLGHIDLLHLKVGQTKFFLKDAFQTEDGIKRYNDVDTIALLNPYEPCCLVERMLEDIDTVAFHVHKRVCMMRLPCICFVVVQEKLEQIFHTVIMQTLAFRWENTLIWVAKSFLPVIYIRKGLEKAADASGDGFSVASHNVDFMVQRIFTKEIDKCLSFMLFT